MKNNKSFISILLMLTVVFANVIMPISVMAAEEAATEQEATAEQEESAEEITEPVKEVIEEESVIPDEEVVEPADTLEEQEKPAQDEEELVGEENPVSDETVPVAEETPTREEPEAGTGEVEEPADEQDGDAPEFVEDVVEKTEELIREISEIQFVTETVEWTELEDGSFQIEMVEMGVEYVFPQDENVKLIFSELPDVTSFLNIKEVVLTDEEVLELGALSNIAYEIISGMENGTFKYDLTLPMPDGAEGEELELKFAEDESDLENAEVQEGEQKKTQEAFTISGLDHFTIFILTTPSPDKTQPAVINEVVVDPATGNEWVEIYNNTKSDIDLTGWSIEDKAGNATSNVSSLVLPAKGFVVFEYLSDKLNNSGPETIILLDNTSAEIDRVKIKSAMGEEVDHYPTTGESVGRVKDGGKEWKIFAAPTKLGTNKLVYTVCAIGCDFVEIEDAIDFAEHKSTIKIKAGSYDMPMVEIDKDLTIIGAGKNKVTIKPEEDTTIANDWSWILVKPGNKFNLSGVTLDGDNTNYLIRRGITTYGEGTIKNNIIKNMHYTPTSYDGRGIVVFGDILIQNNDFSNIRRIGVHVRKAYSGGQIGTATIKNNTFVGKGDGDWLDYGIEIGAASYAKIIGNTISDCTGMASTDGSESGGILVTDYYGVGTVADIIGNTIKNNSHGVLVGYDDPDVSIVKMRKNNIFGNSIQGVNATPNVDLDAKLNWWGHLTGPSGEGSGSGDSITENVKYNPWLCESAPTKWKSVGGICIVPDNVAPTVPVITSPLPEEYLTSSPILNAWEESTDDSGVGKYEIEYIYDDGHTFSGAPYREVPGTQTTRNHTPGISEQGGVTIRVRAYDIYGNISDFSDPVHYFYDETAPTVPVLTSPIGGTTIIDNSPLMQWDDSTDNLGVKGYYYKVRYNCSDVNDINTCTSLYPNATGLFRGISEYQAGATSDGTYYWQVMAEDNAGNQSAWSDSEKVVINAIAPAKPTGLKLLNASQTEEYQCGVYLKERVAVIPDWDDNTESDFSHYEYSSFHPGGAQGLDEKIFTNSIFVNSWVPPVDGQYGYAVRAVDTAGNKSGWSVSSESLGGSCQINYDTVKPEIDFVTPVTDSLLSGILNLKAVCNEDCAYVNFWWRKEGESFNSASKRYHYVHKDGTDFEWGLNTLDAEKADGTKYVMEDGDYYFYAAGKDLAGNWARTPGEIKVSVDNDTPVISLSNPVDGFVKGQVDIIGSVDDVNPHHYWLAIYKGGTGIYSKVVNHSDSFTGRTLYSWDTTSVDDGDYTIKFAERDAANHRTADYVVNVTVKNTLPEKITLTSPMDGFMTRGVAFSQTWEPVSDAVLYEYESCYDDECNSHKWGKTYTGTVKNVGAGQPNVHFWWRVRAKDLADNWGEWSDTWEITIDNDAPVITLNGDDPQIIDLGVGYTELGATTDDGSPVTIDSSLFVDAVGTYDIKYDSSDGVNDAVQIIRTVAVVDNTPEPSRGGGFGFFWRYTQGDLNKSGAVNKSDVVLFILELGNTGKNYADLNGDGKVDKFDFAILMANWG